MGKPEAPYNLPDARGHFGPYGGTFVAETLIEALDELRAAYAAASARYQSHLGHSHPSKLNATY